MDTYKSIIIILVQKPLHMYINDFYISINNYFRKKKTKYFNLRFIVSRIK